MNRNHHLAKEKTLVAINTFQLRFILILSLGFIMPFQAMSCDPTDSLSNFDDFISATIPFFNHSCDDGPIYDSGGSSGNYFNNEDVRYRICPTFAGVPVTVNFASFDLEDGGDFLYIYDEDGVSTTPTAFTGANSPGSFTATNSTGCINIVFSSNGSGTASGFDFSVSCSTLCGTSSTDSNGTNIGSVLIGNTVTQTFTIDNTNSNLALNLSNAAITGDSEFTLGAMPSNIPAEALNFDGSNDYCFANINSPTNFTMEAWVKVDPTGNGYRAFLMWQKTGPNHETSLEVNGAGLVRLGQYDYNNFQFQQVFSSTNIKDGTCHHVAVVVSGNQRLLYIDGVLEGTLTVNNNNNAAENLTDLRIGNIQFNNGNLGEHFKGDIDEVRIWDYARSCQEIINDMGCELTGSESGLMVYYDFNQGLASGNNPSETILFDRTANGYDATLNNFALTAGATSNWIEPGCGGPLNTCLPFLGTIAVSGNGQNISNNDTSPETADDTEYGIIDFGVSDTHTFVIENLGATDLTISGIALSGTGASAFEVDNSLVFPIIIPSLGTQNVDIAFLDNACIPGTFLATVSIDNDDCDDDPYNFNIQGTKSDLTIPNVSCKDITLSPDPDGNVTILPSDIDNGTTDNCSFSLSVSPNTLTCSNTGNNTVILTATDTAGNTSSCTSTVTINTVSVDFVR